MDFLELAKARYSCRSYTEQKVERDKIDKILEAARVAPTAVNYQPQRILVIQDEEKLSKLSECTKWIGYFDSQKVREIYKIPQNYEIVALMPVGYPAKDSKPSEAHYKRNNIESMVFWEEIE